MSTGYPMDAKLKYLAKEYRVKPVLWIPRDFEYERVQYGDCIAIYRGTEECFLLWEPDTAIRKYNLSQIIEVPHAN